MIKLIVALFLMLPLNSYGSGCLARNLAMENAENKEEHAARYSSHIFNGTAFLKRVTTEQTQDSSPVIVSIATSFKVNEKIKFPVSDSSLVITTEYRKLDCSCKHEYELGTEYKIYASLDHDDNKYRVYYCQK